MKLEEPIEFRKLTRSQQLDRIAKLYIIKCTTIEKLYVYKPRTKRTGPCKEYGAIKATLAKSDDNKLLILYDYIFSLLDGTQEKYLLTLTEVFTNAETYRQKLIFERDKTKTAGLEIMPYAPYDINKFLQED